MLKPGAFYHGSNVTRRRRLSQARAAGLPMKLNRRGDKVESRDAAWKAVFFWQKMEVPPEQRIFLPHRTFFYAKGGEGNEIVW